jgi:hypothetical protein
VVRVVSCLLKREPICGRHDTVCFRKCPRNAPNGSALREVRYLAATGKVRPLEVRPLIGAKWVPYSAPLAPSENRESQRVTEVELSAWSDHSERRPRSYSDFPAVFPQRRERFCRQPGGCRLFIFAKRSHNRAGRCSAHQIRIPLLGFLHRLLWTRREYHPHLAHGLTLRARDF